jgi:flagellar biosynthesis GTPase FlhF
VCINSANSSTITLDKLNDIEYLKRYLQEKKRDYLKRELSFFIKDKEVFNNIVGKILDLDIKQKEKLKFNISNIIKSNLANLNDILNEKINKITESLSKELIVVLYPIYQVGDKRFSLISSYCKIENNKLSVQEYKISQDLLDKLLLDKYNITLEEHFGDKTIKDEFFIALNSMNNSNISELKDLVIGELKNKIEKLKDELLNEQWNQAIITIDELSDNYFSPFRDEIMLLKDISKDKKSSLVNKYIFPQNKEHIDQLKVSSHFGSYTNEYVVNEKQWKVVNAIRSNQLISVTGPPGTGKTTVIKEIIADSFVEKTKKIIELWDEEWSEIDLKNSSIFLSPLGGTNFKSILVTSTYNEAVDNIGQEIIK